MKYTSTTLHLQNLLLFIELEWQKYLCGEDTEVYQAVTKLNIGDVIDLEGFLYWYNGVFPHVISIQAVNE